MAGKDFYNTYDMQNKADIIAAAKRYGINEKDYHGFGGRWNDRDSDRYKGDYNDFKDAVKDAANRDYSTRRTLEAKALSGDADARKRAEKGFGTIKSVVDTHEKFKEDHKKRGNNPDDFYSASDWAQMTMAAVDNDRTKQTEKYQDMFASKEDLARVKSVEEQVKEAEPYEPSEKVKAAKERVSNYKTGDTSSSASVFGGEGDADAKNNVFTSGDGEDQRTQASDALAKYKLNLR